MASCCDLLIAEHRQAEVGLAWILERLNQAVQSPGLDPQSWDALRHYYDQWARDLHRHFVIEEQALFALLSQYRTMMLMTVEHDDLQVLQKAFERALQASCSRKTADPDLLTSFLAFKTRLDAHILEEERGIFPLAEACLQPEEQQMALRLFTSIQQQATDGEEPALIRSRPQCNVRETALFQPVDKPLAYETLYEREHASVQHLSLQAGNRQVLHWVGQHQCLVLLSGAVTLETADNALALVPGQCVTLDSQLYFAIQATDDSHLLNFKVWPHPHYTKSEWFTKASGRTV